MTAKTEKQLEDALETKEKELKALQKKFDDLEAKHAQLETSHREVVNKTGYKAPKVHEYKEGECRPVSVNEVCGTCGYDNRPEVDGMRNPRFQMRPKDKQKESHPVW